MFWESKSFYGVTFLRIDLDGRRSPRTARVSKTMVVDADKPVDSPDHSLSGNEIR